MTFDCKPRQHPNAAWREVQGEVVIISPEDSVLHELNATASFIWKHATGEHTAAEIAARMAGEFEVEEAQAREDARELMTHLEAKNLLLTAEAGE